MSKFNIGDKVFCLLHGWGGIETIDNNINDTYPIGVYFPELEDKDCEAYDWYTADGKNTNFVFMPTLLTFEEAKQRYPEYMPKEKVKMYINIEKTPTRIINGQLGYICSIAVPNRDIAQAFDVNGKVVQIEMEID